MQKFLRLCDSDRVKHKRRKGCTKMIDKEQDKSKAMEGQRQSDMLTVRESTTEALRKAADSLREASVKRFNENYERYR